MPCSPRRSADPVGRQPADLLAEVGHRGRDGVVVVSLDPHDARRLRRAKPDREHRPERDRHLPEDVSRASLADDALDPVDELDRLDAALEHGEERALAALVHRVLARHEADVGRCAGKPLALGGAERREDRDPRDLVGRHHEQHPRRRAPAGPAAARPQPGNGCRGLAFTGAVTWQRYSPEPVHDMVRPARR